MRVFTVLQAELLDPAVNGTLDVLRSCKKASIKRVTITSSMADVTYNGKPRTPDVVVDETWFSSAEICEKNQVICCFQLIELRLFFTHGVVKFWLICIYGVPSHVNKHIHLY